MLIIWIKDKLNQEWAQPNTFLIPPLASPVSVSFPNSFETSPKTRFFGPFVFDFLNLSENSKNFPILQETVSEKIFAFKENLEMAAQKLQDFKIPETLVNSVLAELMSLSNLEIPVVYGSLMVRLLKVYDSPEVLEAKLVEAVSNILKNIEIYDITSIERLEVFLGFVISNLSFC